jgi:hypothetical protein
MEPTEKSPLRPTSSRNARFARTAVSVTAPRLRCPQRNEDSSMRLPEPADEVLAPCRPPWNQSRCALYLSQCRSGISWDMFRRTLMYRRQQPSENADGSIALRPLRPPPLRLPKPANGPLWRGAIARPRSIGFVAQNRHSERTFITYWLRFFKTRSHEPPPGLASFFPKRPSAEIGFVAQNRPFRNAGSAKSLFFAFPGRRYAVLPFPTKPCTETASHRTHAG